LLVDGLEMEIPAADTMAEETTMALGLMELVVAVEPIFALAERGLTIECWLLVVAAVVVGIAVPMAHVVEREAQLLAKQVTIAMEIQTQDILVVAVLKIQEEQLEEVGVVQAQVLLVKVVMEDTVVLVVVVAILVVVVPAMVVEEADLITQIRTCAPILPIRKEQGKVTESLRLIIPFHSVSLTGFLCR
jgi:hypothetical protein